MDFLNLKLLSHPVNWVMVWITLALALIAFGAVQDRIAQQGT